MNFDISTYIDTSFDVSVNLSIGCLHDMVDCDVVGMFWYGVAAVALLASRPCPFCPLVNHRET